VADSLAATSGSIDQLYLELTVSASSHPQSGDSADASAEPFIYVDPSFAGAGNYSILVSSGIGNGAASPKPGTLLLLCTGVSAFFVTRRLPGMASVMQRGIAAKPSKTVILALGRSGSVLPQKRC
jgi:hypothetical protein